MSPSAASFSPPWGPSLSSERFTGNARPSPATLDRLRRRYELSQSAVDSLGRLLEALAAEPDPPTAISDPERAVEIHVADSLAALELRQVAKARRLVDIGAGAGFPGLGLAAALPDCRVDLVEATRRKCEVIERLAAAAELENVRVVAARAEEWAGGEGATSYGVVTARALAPLSVLVEYAAPLLIVGGALVAWKGVRNPAEERTGDQAAGLLGLSTGRAHRSAPFEHAHSHHLHCYTKLSPTPARFPRRPGIAVKRPLA